MRFLHLADLHIGKRLNEFNLIEDQRYILDQIVQLALEQEADGVLIAGDVYDRSQPSTEAVELLDDFLTRLSSNNLVVFMISGNHDSPERLSFGSRILEKNRLYVAGGFQGTLNKVTVEDDYGPLHIHLLPFIRPAHIRSRFAERIESFDEAVEAVLSTQEIDTKERNILLAHQFVVSGDKQPELSDSEVTPVGGLDAVDASLFRSFDYVALGHLHRPQHIGSETIRYSGSPLKYSFSEARQPKSVTVIQVGAKGDLKLEQYSLKPLRDLREIKGPIAELVRLGREDKEGAEDYLHITLTDEEEIYDALGQLRPVFPNLMALDFENRRTGSTAQAQIAAAEELERKSPLELFASFYELQNGRELSPEETSVMEEIFQEAGGAEL
jgi:exonuclease SbcD